MNINSFETDQWVPRARDEVFSFFADAFNLESITPPWLRFEILTPGPIEMGAGVRIDYRIRVRGLAIRWRTEIMEWEPPHRFVDVQVRGPYRLWRHTHTFEEAGGGTRCRDRVDYWPRGGRVVDRLFVRRDVRRIFEFRRARLEERFGKTAGAG
jgi:ligand-binding SRPBCC domain-containing protein